MVVTLIFNIETIWGELENLKCIACENILEKNVVTYWNKSYHRKCWKLVKKTHFNEGLLLASVNTTSTALFSSFGVASIFLFASGKPQSEFKEAVCLGLMFLSGIFWIYMDGEANDKLIKKNTKYRDKMATISKYNRQEQSIMWGLSCCPECEQCLEQGPKLITLKMAQPKQFVWTPSGIYHETCIQKGLMSRYERGFKDDYNALWWAYKRAKCRDAINWLFPTSLHVPLRIFNSGFILIASFVLLTKYHWVPDDVESSRKVLLGLTSGCTAALSYALYKV